MIRALPPNEAPPVDGAILPLFSAVAVFDVLAARGDISFGYPLEGCWARSRAMATMAHAIPSVPALEQIWAFPRGAFDPVAGILDCTRLGPDGPAARFRVNGVGGAPGVTWTFHVACTGWAHIGGTAVRVVYDPSLFDGPVTVGAWLEVMNARDAHCLLTSADIVADLSQVGVGRAALGDAAQYSRLLACFPQRYNPRSGRMRAVLPRAHIGTSLAQICMAYDPFEGYDIHSIGLRHVQPRDDADYARIMARFARDLEPHARVVCPSGLRRAADFLIVGALPPKGRGRCYALARGARLVY
jgi:hypothetical protein